MKHPKFWNLKKITFVMKYNFKEASI